MSHKPSAPTDRDECGIPHMLSKPPPPKDAGAREWWIERNAFAPGLHVAIKEKVPLTKDQEPHVVHVIEYAAYEHMREKFERENAALLDKLANKHVVVYRENARLERELAKLKAHNKEMADEYLATLAKERAEIAEAKLPFSMDRHVELMKAYEQARAELAELKNYFDDEEQAQTFGHLIKENSRLNERADACTKMARDANSEINKERTRAAALVEAVENAIAYEDAESVIAALAKFKEGK